MKSSSIFLVGPMGTGKTTIGRQLANVLKKEFIDSDHEIVRRTGAAIPLIFEIEGEEGFRIRETKVIDDLTAMDDVVLATGGGAVIKQENRQFLRERGVVIYLKSSLEQLLQRTRKDKNRPLLQTSDPKAKLEALVREREPLYRDVADFYVYTDDRSVRSVVKEIVARLEDLNT